MALNVCTFQGRIPFDIKMFGDEERKVASFSLSVKRSYKKKEDDYYLEDLLSMKAFGKNAELIEKYFKKGDFAVIHASAVVEDKYTNKDGVEVPARTVFHVNQMHFAEGTKNNNPSGKKEGNKPIAVNPLAGKKQAAAF